MADELGSAGVVEQTTAQVAGQTTSKKFISPSIDIIKTLQGKIELSLRAVGAVSLQYL